MKKSVRRILIIVLAAVMLTGGSLLIRQLIDNRKAADLYANAQNMANFSSESLPNPHSPVPVTPPQDLVTPEDHVVETPKKEPMDDYALQLDRWEAEPFWEINPEVIGWIWLPGTEISYPVMHTSDNETYLHTAWDGTENVAGSIFMETQSDPDFEAFNTIIYGHNMRNGSMFAALHGYKEAEYWETHPYVYIVTPTHIYRYAIFSGYEAPIDSDTYRLYFKGDAQKQTALQFYVDSSVNESPVVPTESDCVLTLSTCTGTGTYESRWVVQAVRTGCWERNNAGLPEKTDVENMFTVGDETQEP